MGVVLGSIFMMTAWGWELPFTLNSCKASVQRKRTPTNVRFLAFNLLP